MPSWHLKSTISGDLTALGIQAASREAEHRASHILDTLSQQPAKQIDGLPLSQDSKAMIDGMSISGLPGQDVKPTIDKHADCGYLFVSAISRLTRVYSIQIMTAITPSSKQAPLHKSLMVVPGTVQETRRKISSHPSLS